MEPYARETTFGRSVAEAAPALRAAFIRKTYAHLALALLSFIVLEAVLLHSPLAPLLTEEMTGGQFSWLIVQGLAMLGTWQGNTWANARENIALQYMGLAVYVIIYALIFLPLMLIAVTYYPGVIFDAAVMTGALFLGLSATVFLTRKDFSFLGPIVAIGGLIALGVIVAAIFTGFSLGIVFSAVVVALMAASILYTTSNMLHHYQPGQHVAASLQLCAALLTMFWYILRIFMSRR